MTFPFLFPAKRKQDIKRKRKNFANRSKRNREEESKMCWLSETYHAPCGHWGNPALSSSCAAGSSLRSGCWNSTVQGVLRLNTLCTACRYRASIRTIEGSVTITWRDGELVKGFDEVVVMRRAQRRRDDSRSSGESPAR